MLEQLDFVLFTFESVFGTCAALGAKQYQLIDGKLSLCENTKKLLSNGATRAHNCYFHKSVFIFIVITLSYRKGTETATQHKRVPANSLFWLQKYNFWCNIH